MSEVRTRMAPSPTGNLHIGTAYATLWPYLFARKNKGVFILRIEDTDTERSKKEFEENIIKGLEWLGFKWDEGPFHQTERLEKYDSAIEKLIAEDKAYYCFCTTEELDKERTEQSQAGKPQVYSGKCRNLSVDQVKKNLSDDKEKIVRLKVPEDRGVIKFKDLLHGEVEFDSKLIGDLVIRRTNGMPLYNFVVVIDDIDMKVTHILRGDDHLSNTPKQILMFEALGADLPEFAHNPVILNSDRVGKLSKRDNATSVDDYRKDGFLSEAIVNYLALIGWTMPDDKEIMSLAEMEETFSIEKMRLSPAAFDIIKLEWINGEYIRKMSDENFLNSLIDYLNYMSDGELAGTKYEDMDKLKKIVPLVKERVKKLSDFVPMTDFLFDDAEYDKEVFLRLKIKDLRSKIENISQKMENLEKPWKSEDFEQTFRKLAEELEVSVSDMFQLIRVCVSGQTVTPPLFESIQILGEDEAIKRVKEASNRL